MRILAPSAAVLVTAALASAQLPQTLSGRVVAASNPCTPTATHRVDCSNVFLRSSAVDLTTIEGTVRELSGTLFVLPRCLVLEVTAADSPGSTTRLSAFFGYRPGRNVLWTTNAPVGSLVIYMIAGRPGFVPLGNFGALMLDPFTLHVESTPDISIGIALRSYTIPNSPSIVGCELFSQLIVARLEPLEAELLNPVCFTVVQ